MSSIVHYVSNNASQVDAGEAAAKLNDECPKLLQPNETVVLAFKERGGKGRDSCVFTTHRIVHRDKTGMTGKKIKYLSIPYGSIKAYAVETAGTMDSDSELKVIYAEGRYYAIDFAAKSTDIMAIKRFLNDRVLVEKDGATGFATTPQNFASPEGKKGGGNVLDWMGDDMTQIDAGTVESQLKSDPEILLPDERVELAFKCGRDSFLCTTKRLICIDVQGLTGKRIKYLSLLWKCCRAFSVETAGGFLDRDAELVIYTNICGIGRNNTGGDFPSLSRIDVDFKKGKADIYAVQKFFADKILGVDEADEASSVHHAAVSGSENGGSASNFLSWMGDDNKMIDPEPVDRQYHTSPPILQNSERVELAFKGRRDLVLFTTKRLLIVDMKGWKGKKVEYVTVPWKNVQVFSVRSAGSWMDKDSEMRIWTDFNDIWFPPKENEDDDSRPPPVPRKTFIEIDFKKDAVDLMAIQRYLAERCLHVEGTGAVLPSDVPVSPDVMAPGDPNGAEKLLNWIGDNAAAIDPKAMDAQLHEVTPVLQADEHVVMAYKAGRDAMVYTTKRVLRIDVQGFSGKKVEWQSIPYRSIRCFSVESAGSFDADAEVKLWCGTYWLDGPKSVIKQDLRKGKCDIIAIHNLLSAMVFGGQDGSPRYDGQALSTAQGSGGGSFGTFLSWATSDGVEIDPKEVDGKLHSDPPLLQPDEHVEVCYKVGRDLMVYTTKRILRMDRKGMTGKKIEYTSFPLRYCEAFKVQSAGHLMSEAKVSIYMDIPGESSLGQEIKKKGTDYWALHTTLASKMLR